LAICMADEGICFLWSWHACCYTEGSGKLLINNQNILSAFLFHPSLRWLYSKFGALRYGFFFNCSLGEVYILSTTMIASVLHLKLIPTIRLWHNAHSIFMNCWEHFLFLVELLERYFSTSLIMVIAQSYSCYLFLSLADNNKYVYPTLKPSWNLCIWWTADQGIYIRRRRGDGWVLQIADQGIYINNSILRHMPISRCFCSLYWPFPANNFLTIMM
jgi:hypothetical protein